MDTIENFIGVFPEAVTSEYCDRVIGYFETCNQSGLVYNRQQAENCTKLDKDDEAVFAHEEFYLATSLPLYREFHPVFLKAYNKYLDKYDVLKRLPSTSNFWFKIQKTKIGGGYHIWHFESGDRTTCNRLFAWILYLNDVEDGGETEFLYMHKRIKPKKGTLLIFPANFTHTHRGNPPLLGTKYILTGWVDL